MKVASLRLMGLQSCERGELSLMYFTCLSKESTIGQLETMTASLWVKYKTGYLHVDKNQNKHILELDVVFFSHI